MDLGESKGKFNRFLSLPREEQAMLRRAHQNLCHPSPEQLSMVLRNQGVRPEVSQAVFDMKCENFASHQQPKIARPSTLKHELDFNDKVFIDGITWTSKAGKTFHFYHILDQATNFHVATPAPNRAAEQAAQCVSESWFQWAGPPNVLVTDSGTEFTSEYFTEFLQRFDVKSVTAAPHAHWQNGRSERHGHILQTMLNKIDHDMPIQTYVDLQQALVQCTHAKNKLSVRKGFSPEVLVFGKNSKVPGSVTSCETVSSLASADREDAHGIAFRRSLALREKARVAFHEADNDQALRRACLRRSRPDRNAYDPGEWVMLWQPEPTGGHWFGPLKVVAQEGSNSIWATQGGSCIAEHLNMSVQYVLMKPRRFHLKT
jgi:transposase InsO family protein